MRPGRRVTPIDLHIGRELRAIRKKAGMSQKSLAALMGITYQQLQKYEEGKNRISAGRLYQASRALNVPFDDFFMPFLPTLSVEDS